MKVLDRRRRGDPRFAASWVLSLTSTNLVLVRRAHAAGASPCSQDPSTWSVAGGLTMVR
jgi:hypothetical protein